MTNYLKDAQFCLGKVCQSDSTSQSQVYYKEAVGAFVVFDVTRLSTFEAVQMWKADLDNKVLLPNGKPIPAVLLANKVSPSPSSSNGVI